MLIPGVLYHPVLTELTLEETSIPLPVLKDVDAVRHPTLELHVTQPKGSRGTFIRGAPDPAKSERDRKAADEMKALRKAGERLGIDINREISKKGLRTKKGECMVRSATDSIEVGHAGYDATVVGGLDESDQAVSPSPHMMRSASVPVIGTEKKARKRLTNTTNYARAVSELPPETLFESAPMAELSHVPNEEQPNPTAVESAKTNKAAAFNPLATAFIPSAAFHCMRPPDEGIVQAMASSPRKVIGSQSVAGSDTDVAAANNHTQSEGQPHGFKAAAHAAFATVVIHNNDAVLNGGVTSVQRMIDEFALTAIGEAEIEHRLLDGARDHVWKTLDNRYPGYKPADVRDPVDL